MEVNRGLPAPLLLKYFTKTDPQWVVKDEIKKTVEFRQLNLFKPWPIMPMFDVVFIRNVMIYFGVDTKKPILKRIRACLHPQGSLFLGTAESTMNIDPEWQPVVLDRATAYRSAQALATAT